MKLKSRNKVTLLLVIAALGISIVGCSNNNEIEKTKRKDTADRVN